MTAPDKGGGAWEQNPRPGPGNSGGSITSDSLEQILLFYRGFLIRLGREILLLEGGEGRHEIGRKRELTIVDTGAEFAGGTVSGAQHLKLGIQIVDVVKHEGFRGAWEGRRSECKFAVVTQDEVEKVQTHLVVRWCKLAPRFRLLGSHKFLPEVVDHLEPQWDVAHHFAEEAHVLGEAGLRVVVLPQFAAVVEEDADKKKVPVEIRVDGTYRCRATHHLGHVLNEAAPARVVVSPGGGGAAENFLVLEQELAGEGLQPGIADGVTGLNDVFPVCPLLGPGFRIPGQEFFDFVVFEFADPPVFAVDTVAILGPLARKGQESAHFQNVYFGELRMVAPGFQRETGSCIDKSELEVGISLPGGFFLSLLKLGRQDALAGAFSRSLP